MSGNGQKKPIVYLETTFVSRLTGWLSRTENSVRREQLATREWWRRAEGKVQAVVSYLVWTEIADGDPECAARRARAIERLPMWRQSTEATVLADALVAANAVKKEKQDDALHIALAVVGGADVLLSWNFQDIVNGEKLPIIKAVVERAGYRCPLVTSPDKLPEELP